MTPPDRDPSAAPETSHRDGDGRAPAVIPRRLLVLAYYFPPLGGSGVQRVASLARYLPTFGWHPTVVTARPGRYFAFDEGLADDVHRAGVRVVATSTLDPTRGGEGRAQMPAGRWGRLLSALSAWAFVPDNKVGWSPFALAAAEREHRAAPFDAVLSTAPPYTSLLVGARLARRWDVPFVVDLRDDWLGNPRHRYPTAVHRRLHAVLERRVLAAASAVFVISGAMREAVSVRHPGLASRLHIVPQGYDPADFPGEAARQHAPSGEPMESEAVEAKAVETRSVETGAVETGGRPMAGEGTFRIVYAGVFYDAQRPDTFLAALAQFVAAHPDAPVAADFYGLVPPDFGPFVANLGLGAMVTYHGYLPHRALAGRLAGASLLWMTVGERPGAEGISTGKLFEYVGTRRPILGLVPLRGTAAEALRAYGAAWVVAPGDTDGAARAIGEAWTAWTAGTRTAADAAFIRRHDRRRIAGEVAA